MDDRFDLSGKVALVTGGSRGLGREMVLAFAEHGADVVIASRKLDACEELAHEVTEQTGRRAVASAFHAGKWEQADQLAELVYAEFGRCDVLVNNAGMSPLYPSLPEVSEELFDKVVGVNFKGPFRLAANMGRRMADADGGVIINISSMAAVKPVTGVTPYSGAKAALNAMTVSLAHEFGPKVRVNAIQAGPFLTDISKAWPEEMRQTAANALGRPGNPEEVVTTALYLASDASSFVTGAVVACDGGIG